jgi:hypothetical protein
MADEVLQELWRIKDENARRFNGDVDALFAELRRRHPSHLLRPPRRRAAQAGPTAQTPTVTVAEADSPYVATPRRTGRRGVAGPPRGRKSLGRARP